MYLLSKKEVVMENKLYELGAADLYSVAMSETQIEQNPAILIRMREEINIEGLEKALKKIIPSFPIFASTLAYRDGRYSLFESEGDMPIINSEISARPAFLGKSSGGYLFRICIDGCELLLEWSNILTDEYGGMTFLLALICRYLGEKAHLPYMKSAEVFLEDLTRESKKTNAAGANNDVSDKKVKKKKSDYSKIGGALIPTKKNPDGALVHILRIPAKALCETAGRKGASAESVLIPIFSNVLFRRKREQDNGVTADLTINCRTDELDSMHNFTVVKTLTYSAPLGKTDVKRASKLYEQMLDSTSDRESIRAEAERTIDAVSELTSMRPRFLRDLASLAVSKAVRAQRSNFSFLNFGTLPLAPTAISQIESITPLLVPASADAAVAVLRLGKDYIVSISENYVDEKIITDFVGILARLGLTSEEESQLKFRQSRIKLK